MTSLRNLDDIEQTARRAAREQSPDLSALRSSIYDVVVHAFMNGVLTLDRMNSVIQAVRSGVDAGTLIAAGWEDYTLAVARQEAYRGLCTAAGEALAAVGLACGEFFKLHGSNLSIEVGNALLQEALVLRQQLEQVTRGADWVSNIEVTSMQSRWFQELFEPSTSPAKQARASASPWSARFLQECGCEFPLAKNDTRACLMLLGLFTSGALVGVRALRARVDVALISPARDSR